MARVSYLYYSQIIEFLGQLLGRIDNLGIVGMDLNYQSLEGFIGVASLDKVIHADELACAKILIAPDYWNNRCDVKIFFSI